MPARWQDEEWESTLIVREWRGLRRGAGGAHGVVGRPRNYGALTLLVAERPARMHRRGQGWTPTGVDGPWLVSSGACPATPRGIERCRRVGADRRSPPAVLVWLP